MTYSSSSRVLAVGLALCLFGAGCAAKKTPPTASNGAMAFGKLPSLLSGDAQFATRDSMAPGMPTAAAVPMPPATAEANVASGVMTAPSGVIKARPIPSPYPKPVAVEYTIGATLPTWNTSGDVLLVNAVLPNAADAGQFARSAGLPSQALGNSDSITSINLQWKDKDAFQWSFDAGNRNVSFWKQTTNVMPVMLQDGNAKQPPQMPNDEAIKIADAFLDAHGFGSVRQTGGTVEDSRIMMPMADGVDTPESAPAMYPCPIIDAKPIAAPVPATKDAAVGSTAVSEPAMPTSILRPCGWWPQTITVMYGGTRDGMTVTDMYGNLQRTASVTINIETKDVSGGNLQLDQAAERSSYPMIDAEAAKKRLQSGGQNPVWPWGSESGTIKVNITDAKIVWMRYDNWQDGAARTYFIPGLLATGTVDRGIKGQPPEIYRTVVPLVDDSAFDQTVPPMPMPYATQATPPSAPPSMGGGSGGGATQGSSGVKY